MSSVMTFQERLDRMMAEDPNGIQAEQLLRRLTVFPDTFDADAAVALAPRDMPEPVTLTALITLQQWGLMGRVAQAEPRPIEAHVLEAIPPQAETFATLQAWGLLERETVPSRYFLLKSILKAMPPDEDAQTRRYEYYRRLHGNLQTSIVHNRYPLISADWPNIQAALVWGMTHTPRTVFDFAWALNSYMRDCLPRQEWRAIIEGMLDTAHKNNNVGEQGNTLTMLGVIAHLEGDLSRAHTAYTEALACYKQMSDMVRRIEMLSKKVIDDLIELDTQYETGRDVFMHVLDMSQAPGKALQQLIVLYHLHDVQIRQGEFAGARESLLQLMAIYQHLRDERGQCDILTHLGQTSAHAGDLIQARDDFAWALRMSERADYPIGQMKALWAWGQTEYRNSQKEAGYALCRQAIVVAMRSSRVQDHIRAEDLRAQLAVMESGAHSDGAH